MYKKDTSSLSNHAIRISNNTLDFSMAISNKHTRPETKTNKIQAPDTTKDANSPSIKAIRMATIKTPLEPKQPNFCQMTLGKPQIKLRPLRQQSKGRNHPTEGLVYMGDEHHDEASMGCNQSM